MDAAEREYLRRYCESPKLLDRDGNVTIFSATVPDRHPHHRRWQLQIKLRSDDGEAFWLANRAAKLGFADYVRFEKLPPAQRRKEFRRRWREAEDMAKPPHLWRKN